MTDIQIMKKAIKTYGETEQVLVAIEEMAELTKELTKNQRGEWNINEIAEEMADVYITLCELQLIFCIDDSIIAGYKDVKMKRLKRRMEEEE